MPRNGFGTEIIPNTFNAGETITASGHNQNYTDIATELSRSLCTDGQSTMTGPVNAANGSAAAPSYAFGSNPNTGFWRKALNVIGISINGTEVGYIDSSGFALRRIPTVVTTAGPFTITTEKILVLNKSAPSPTTINLPAVAAYGDGEELEIIDWAGNAGDMTLLPNGIEKIMGLASWIVGSGGVAGSGGSLKLRASVALAGWIVR